jgi:spore coat protein U-like protein
MKRFILFLVLNLGAMLGGAGAAHAACIAILQCTCSASAPTVAFGQIMTINTADIDISPNLTVTCQSFLASLAFSYEVRLSTGASGSYANRTMKKSSDALRYQMFVNAGRTQIWGDGISGTSVAAKSFMLISIGTQTDYWPIYSRLYGGQNVPPGHYSDSITISIIY